MKRSRLLAGILACLTAIDLVAGGAGVRAATPGATSGTGGPSTSPALRHVKVAIIVGPVGAFSSEYRAYADEAAAAARHSSDDVVTVYTPDATWPAVRAALDGASVVLYLGHGNGWPNPYGDVLRPDTQDGVGLNPVAGVDDTAHQYFGEAYLRRAVHLASGAVVVLGHLCYASGAAEPGMPQPALDVAVQRVDNFGAGWIAAGAAAVIAEAHAAPAWYMDALLGGRGSIEAAWRANPAFHDHAQAFDSVRTPGARLLLDPDEPGTGFYRSLVLAPGAAGISLPVPSAGGSAGDPAPGAPPEAVTAPAWTTPVALGLAGPVVTASTAGLTLRFGAGRGAALPPGLMVGTSWDPLVLDAAPPAMPPPPAMAPADPAAGLPAPDPVVPESVGTVVVTTPAAAHGATRRVRVITPDIPGLYRLVTTLHGPDGVALDAASQSMVPALIVRVTGRLWATYGVAPGLVLPAGAAVPVPVRVGNPGVAPWSLVTPDDPVSTGAARPVRPPALVARWLQLGAGVGPVPGLAVPLPASIAASVEPGRTALVDLPVTVPAQPGSWLLVLDIVTADGRSLAAAGVPAGVVAVTVAAAAGPVLPGVGAPPADLAGPRS